MIAEKSNDKAVVNYILNGNIQKINDDFRINITLISQYSGALIWSQQYEYPIKTDSTLEVLHKILSNLEPQLIKAMFSDIDASKCSSSQRQIFEAVTMLSLQGWHQSSFVHSANLLRRSLIDEPNNALALSYLALILGLGQRIGILDKRKESFREAITVAEKALAIESMNSTILGLVGCALADLKETDRAIPILKRAIDLNPNNGQAFAALGAANLIIGNFNETIKLLETGISLSPADGKIAVWGTILALAYLQNRISRYCHSKSTAC
ncbi:MAG: hypothetical protein ACRBCS_08125 [Cellvibrionaceae bacterium]